MATIAATRATMATVSATAAPTVTTAFEIWFQ
jgi:hypothetical protein